MPSKFYGVKQGRSPGVYTSWDECSKQVTGFSGAVFKSFTSLKEAYDFVNDLSLNEGTLYIDGGHSKHTGDTAWGRVIDSKGTDLVALHAERLGQDLCLLKTENHGTVIVAKFDDVVSQQNNGAELLAMVFALRVASIDPTITEIASDSELIVKWWSKSLTTRSREKMDPRKVVYVDELIGRALRGPKIVKIDGASNPADFGWGH